jgi:hypothetical protein
MYGVYYNHREHLILIRRQLDMKKYLAGSIGRGKQFYFDTLEEAIEKASKLNKNRASKKVIIEGVVENGTYVYYYENRIEY